MELEDILKRISKLMDNEDRTDPEFRALLVMSELGDVVKYLTHDPKLNPGARPHGSSEDEVLAYGQTLAMLFATMYLRNIDPETAMELGLRNWEDADWRKIVAKTDLVEGMVAYPGHVEAPAYVVGIGNPICKVAPGNILVARFPRPADTPYLVQSSGLVTDQGGTTSHAAIIAKQYKIPCIVGTGNATRKIENGAEIILNARGDKGRVTLKMGSGDL